MKITRRIKQPSIVFPGTDKDGYTSVVVQIKTTFRLPTKKNKSVSLAEIQKDFVESDVFWGEEALSATRYECDYVCFKPYCDVLLNGSAYTTLDPAYGRPQVEVSLTIDQWKKSFLVVGDRRWQRSIALGTLKLQPSKPEPFYSCSISYDNAFGGTDRYLEESEDRVECLYQNPFGKGFFKFTPAELIENQPVPNTEEVNCPIKSASDKYRPMSFGAIPRVHPDRAMYVGTYDKYWRDYVAPMLPADFDERFYQSAPRDQQLPYLKGGERVTMKNLTPELHIQFELPKLELYSTLIMKSGEELNIPLNIDTLLLEPDEQLFTITHRGRLPLAGDFHDVDEVIIGKYTKAMRLARIKNKEYHGSLKELLEKKKYGLSLATSLDDD